MTVGEFIKNRRESLGLTMREVSEAVGVSEATVCRWESGSIGSMRQSRIAALAAVLRVPPEQIVMADRVAYTDDEVKIMEHLKELRKQKGLKQKELGALVGCSEATICMYEAGKRSPDYETLLKLSDTLGCSVDELLRGKTELMASPELDEKRQRLEAMTTGERIKELRKQKGMSAEVLAERCGYSAASMYRYEKGDIEKAEYTRLVKIAEALGTTPEYLLLGDVAEKDAAALDEKRQRLVESVKDMTDDQVDLLQKLVDQIDLLQKLVDLIFRQR